MLVLPDTFEIAVELGETNTPDMDSSEYSPVRPGSDPSELFGVRDYREGDALKRIHWKLSEKYDRTVVREASLPVARSILLLLDNAPEGAIAPEKVSAAVEGLMSASESLAGQGISHEIGWLNHETDQLELRRISSLDDLFGEQGDLRGLFEYRHGYDRFVRRASDCQCIAEAAAVSRMTDDNKAAGIGAHDAH